MTQFRFLLLSAASIFLACRTSHAQTPPVEQAKPDNNKLGSSNIPLQDAKGRISEPPAGPGLGMMEIEYDELEQYGKTGIRATNVTIKSGEYVVTGRTLDGDTEKDLVFTGNPTISFRGQVLAGERIVFTPRTRAFHIDNLHSALSPEFLQGKAARPLFVSGGSVSGTKGQPIIGVDLDATSCDAGIPHYLIRGRSVTFEPGKRIVLRKATLFLWNHAIITLPTFVIPLDQQSGKLKANHLPTVGRSQDEGWFAKNAFNYLLSSRAPGLLRLDLMEKKGIGIGVDQVWNFAKSAGQITLYGIPTGGTNKNVAARINQRQNLGGGETLTLDNDYQRNSYLSLPQSTNLSTRFGFSRNVEGATTTLNFARQSTQTEGQNGFGGTSSKSYTTNFAQSFQLSKSTSMNFGGDYSLYSNSSPGSTAGSTITTTTQQLAARFQADQRESNYTLSLAANRNVPVGKSTGSSFFGGVEKLPELTLSNYRFTQGVLSHVPATFMLAAGKFSEGAGGFGGAASGNVSTERMIVGVDVNGQRYSLTKSTDLSINSGFQQYLYGTDGIAQYVVRNNTTLTQRFNSKSGINLNYTYQRPEGGTPFRFDQQGKFHALNADVGFLGDPKFQLTARVGYDFNQTAFSGVKSPWQTLSANMQIRPVSWAKWQTLYSFDPNTMKFVSATTDLRLRGANDTSLDLVGRFDPRQHKFAQINGYLSTPSNKMWRLIALVQYNGYLGKFESRNIQLVRDLHCMEASLTYIDNPFGFRNDKQVFFQLKFKAFPSFSRFGTGQFGQAIDTGVGGVY